MHEHVPSVLVVVVVDSACLEPIAGRSAVDWAVRVAVACSRVQEVCIASDDAMVLRWARSRELPTLEQFAFPESVGEALQVASHLPNSDVADCIVLLNATRPLISVDDVETLIDYCVRERTAAVLVRSVVQPAWGVKEEHQAYEDLGAAYALPGKAAREERQESASAESKPRIAPVDAGALLLCDVRSEEGRVQIEAVLNQRKQRAVLSKLPKEPSAIVFDFDGVFTDNKVLVRQDGVESVVCHRGDGLGIERLRGRVPMAILSKERNSVVRARADKLGLECWHGVDDKLTLLRGWAEQRGYAQNCLVYVGNDINDLECLRWAGVGIAVNDAHPEALSAADVVLSSSGGDGALRELSDLLVARW